MTEKLINLVLTRSKFIKDQLIEINKNIEKLGNTQKNCLAKVFLNFFDQKHS